MRRLALLLVLSAACTKAGTGNESPPGEPVQARPAVAPIPVPAKVTPPKPTTRIELTAVTLADDCGGAAPSHQPGKGIAGKSKAKSAQSKQDAAYQRRCEQTSMQLSITASDAGKIQVKSVELFDDAGKSLGTLTASKPTRWSDTNGLYETWDETLTAGTTNSVSYVLSQPRFDAGEGRWNRTYTLKTVLSIGGVDQAAQKDVTLTAPTTLPANVKT